MSRIHARISLVSFTLVTAFAHAPAAIAGYYYSPVDPPGSIASEALGLNDSGVVVGEYSVQTGTGPSTSSFQYGFVRQSGRLHDAGKPNPDSICGGYGPMCNAAWGVNNAGDVVGTYFTDDGAAHGFLYTNGNYSTFTELNVPVGSTQAFGISNNGLIAAGHRKLGRPRLHLRHIHQSIRHLHSPGSAVWLQHSSHSASTMPGR